jgi:hypothetical protein
MTTVKPPNLGVQSSSRVAPLITEQKAGRASRSIVKPRWVT